MALSNKIFDLFKSRESKKKETDEERLKGTVAQEKLAEEELQVLLDNPAILKTLCSILTASDAARLFGLCDDVAKGKANVKKEDVSNATNLVGIARWGIEYMRDIVTKECELAGEVKKVQSLKTAAEKGDFGARLDYPTQANLVAMRLGMFESFQRGGSVCALSLLETAVLTGRIKDLGKMPSIIAKAQAENTQRRNKLGLVRSTEIQPRLKSGGRSGK